MLILSRKKGQKLIINDNIEVIIIDSDNGVVKLGVNAPKNITIYREEIYKELKKANLDSQETQINSLNDFLKDLQKVELDNKLKSLSVKIVKNEEK